MANLIKVKLDGREICIESEGEATKAEALKRVGVIDKIKDTNKRG